MASNKNRMKLMNMVYGLGASVVILGALFKIMHWPFGNEMLIIGLVTEAVVFAVSAFEPIDDDLDWSLVYPELAGGLSQNTKKVKEQPQDAEGLLSKKLDELLNDAKSDDELMASIGNSIKQLEGVAKGIIPTVDTIGATRKYGEEMS